MITNRQKNEKARILAIFGSLISAITASICCIGPVVLAVLGAGSAGLFSMFGELRPYLIGITTILLGSAFYLTYRKRKIICEDGSYNTRSSNKWSKITLWTAAILVVFFLAFPHLVGSLNTSSAGEKTTEETSEVAVVVEGMTCSGCEFTLEKAINKLDGVIEAKANYQKREVKVTFKKGEINVDEIVKAINKTGYRAIKQ